MHFDAAKRLLASEGCNGGGAEEYADAAGRVYAKLHLLLDPLVGTAGVQALLRRSAKLSQEEFACLGDSAVVESAAKLRDALLAQESNAAATAAAFFGAFLALMTTFIGERLTAEVLRRAWPTIEESAPKETEK